MIKVNKHLSGIRPKPQKVGRQITLYLTSEYYASLQIYCAAEKVSASSIVDALIHDFLDSRQAAVAAES